MVIIEVNYILKYLTEFLEAFRESRVYIYEFKFVEEGCVRAYLYNYPANTTLHRYSTTPPPLCGDDCGW